MEPLLPPWRPQLVLQTLKQVYPLSHTAIHLQQSIPATSFPFEKLPPELRLKVLRFAMPQHGLRPLPLPSDFDEHDPTCLEYVGALRREQSTPLNLFWVNRWISTEVLKILHGEAVFRIDIDPSGIRFLGRKVGEPHKFRSHTFLGDLAPFNMRNYELFISMDRAQYLVAKVSPWRYRDYCYDIKE